MKPIFMREVMGLNGGGGEGDVRGYMFFGVSRATEKTVAVCSITVESVRLQTFGVTEGEKLIPWGVEGT